MLKSRCKSSRDGSPRANLLCSILSRRSLDVGSPWKTSIKSGRLITNFDPFLARFANIIYIKRLLGIAFFCNQKSGCLPDRK